MLWLSKQGHCSQIWSPAAAGGADSDVGADETSALPDQPFDRAVYEYKQILPYTQAYICVYTYQP